MALRFQIIIGVVLVLAMLLILQQVRKNKLNLRFALLWLVLGILMLIIDIFPEIVAFAAKALGMELASNLLFFLGICFTLILVFGLTLKVSKLSDEAKRLTQEVALLKEESDTIAPSETKARNTDDTTVQREIKASDTDDTTVQTGK